MRKASKGISNPCQNLDRRFLQLSMHLLLVLQGTIFDSSVSTMAEQASKRISLRRFVAFTMAAQTLQLPGKTLSPFAVHRSVLTALPEPVDV